MARKVHNAFSAVEYKVELNSHAIHNLFRDASNEPSRSIKATIFLLFSSSTLRLATEVKTNNCSDNNCYLFFPAFF